MSGDAAAEKESPHITAVRKQWKLKKLAAERKNIPFSPAHDLETTLAIARAGEAEATVKIIANAETGQMIDGHGVLIGTWQPQGLSQTFNVFAAPEDLTDEAGQKAIFRYPEALKRIAALTDWHGHHGTSYEADTDLYKALKDGSYIKDGSGWFIPPRELLTGTRADGASGIRQNTIIQTDNLYDHKDKGDLSGSVTTAAKWNNSGCAKWYWSSTEMRNYPPHMWAIDFADAHEDWHNKSIVKLSCRPIRLEEARL